MNKFRRVKAHIWRKKRSYAILAILLVYYATMYRLYNEETA